MNDNELKIELLDREREHGRLLAESENVDGLITRTLEDAIERGANLDYVTVYVKDLMIATNYVWPWELEKKLKQKKEADA